VATITGNHTTTLAIIIKFYKVGNQRIASHHSYAAFRASLINMAPSVVSKIMRVYCLLVIVIEDRAAARVWL
jgi:hypothetical protein